MTYSREVTYSQEVTYSREVAYSREVTYSREVAAVVGRDSKPCAIYLILGLRFCVLLSKLCQLG